MKGTFKALLKRSLEEDRDRDDEILPKDDLALERLRKSGFVVVLRVLLALLLLLFFRLGLLRLLFARQEGRNGEETIT